MANNSGSITSGGTSQAAVAADPSRRRLFVENPPSATESLFVAFGEAATVNGGTPNSYELGPGGVLEFIGDMCPNTSINVIAATTGHKFICFTN